ncbi:MAG: type II toxin-antitoxin system RelE/ParE family toxin [Dissulfurispiraceae bacterium]|jgi:mRNA interferase RelE/StbE|nr:type II toxin-antitoxin system RelE/ParE family toxin [Dissulfurispiraceae bacterium]
MSWTIKFSSHAEKYYKRLDSILKTRIKKELLELSALEHPLTHQAVKPLTGELRGFYRLRIGSYRIVFSLIVEDQKIAVINLAPRGEAYKN